MSIYPKRAPCRCQAKIERAQIVLNRSQPALPRSIPVLRRQFFCEGPECRPEELENGLEWSYQNSCNLSLNLVNRVHGAEVTLMCLTYRISCVDVELRVTEKAAKFVDVAFAYQREESLNVGAAS